MEGKSFDQGAHFFRLLANGKYLTILDHQIFRRMRLRKNSQMRTQFGFFKKKCFFFEKQIVFIKIGEVGKFCYRMGIK